MRKLVEGTGDAAQPDILTAAYYFIAGLFSLYLLIFDYGKIAEMIFPLMFYLVLIALLLMSVKAARLLFLAQGKKSSYFQANLLASIIAVMLFLFILAIANSAWASNLNGGMKTAFFAFVPLAAFLSIATSMPYKRMSTSTSGFMNEWLDSLSEKMLDFFSTILLGFIVVVMEITQRLVLPLIGKKMEDEPKTGAFVLTFAVLGTLLYVLARYASYIVIPLASSLIIIWYFYLAYSYSRKK